MKRTIVTVESLDDYELAEDPASKTEATTTVRLAYHDGRPGAPVQVELDLADFNRAALEKIIGPWLKAGHKPAAPVMSPIGRPARTGTGYKHSPGIVTYNREMRAWADQMAGEKVAEVRNPYHYNTSTKDDGALRYFYSKSLRSLYAQMLERAERQQEGPLGD